MYNCLKEELWVSGKIQILRDRCRYTMAFQVKRISNFLKEDESMFIRRTQNKYSIIMRIEFG